MIEADEPDGRPDEVDRPADRTRADDVHGRERDDRFERLAGEPDPPCGHAEERIGYDRDGTDPERTATRPRESRFGTITDPPIV